MDVVDIASPPRALKSSPRLSTTNQLFRRQLSLTTSNADRSYSPAFAPDSIQSMSFTPTFTHTGCVNTANFNSNGTLLATGSDDLRLKIWQSTNFANPDLVKKRYDIATGHSSNIFHALVSASSFDDVAVQCN